MSMKISPLVLLALLTLPMGAHAALHFGVGVAYYDNEYIHYTDKGYYDDFSMDLGVYSDFNKSHMVYLDAHLYTDLSSSVSGVSPIIYVGIGGIFVKDTDNYSHEHSPNEYEDNWGIRLPIGIELMTAADISVFAEVIPTYIVSPNDEYETTATFGIRYYFY